MADLMSRRFVRTPREDPADAGMLRRVAAGGYARLPLGLAVLTGAELLGVPRTVVVGRRAADGVVEIRDRRSGDVEEVRVDDVVWAVTR